MTSPFAVDCEVRVFTKRGEFLLLLVDGRHKCHPNNILIKSNNTK